MDSEPAIVETAIIETDYEVGQDNISPLGLDIHNPVFLVSGLSIIVFVILSLAFQAEAAAFFSARLPCGGWQPCPESKAGSFSFPASSVHDVGIAPSRGSESGGPDVPGLPAAAPAPGKGRDAKEPRRGD